MRFDKIAIRGLGPFVDTAIDLDAVAGKIVAVTGPNGAGKSTFLELLSAGVYRTTKTRGSLADLATKRDAFVEVTINNGCPLTIRHQVDGTSRKGESVVMDENMRPLLPSGKVAEFDTWAKANMPAQEVFFNSVFAAQGSGGFLDATTGDRKSIILRVLGVERLERLAKLARDKERDAREAVSVARTRVSDERNRGGDVAEAERRLSGCKQASWTADQELEAAKVQLAKAEEQAREVASAIEARNAYMERRGTCLNKRDDANGRVKNLRTRIANNQGLLSQADEIRGAVDEVGRLREEVANLESERASHARDAEEARRTAADWRSRAQDALQRERTATNRATTAADRRKDATKVSEAVASLDRLREQVSRDNEGYREASDALEALRGQQVLGMEGRVGALRGGLRRIASIKTDEEWIVNAEEAAEHAFDVVGTTLQSDDDAVRLAQELPKKIAQRKAASEVALQRMDNAKKALERAERVAARAPEMEQALTDHAEATKDVETAQQERKNAEKQAEDWNCKNTLARGLDEGLVRSADDKRARIQQLKPLVDTAQHLEAAEARIEELRPQLAIAEQDLQRAQDDIDSLGEQTVVPEQPNVASFRSAQEQAERTARDAHASVSMRARELEQAKESVERLSTLLDEQTAAETELSDWVQLGQDLGKSGLQAFEIDAVGPELTELVNDLLRTCVGPRWTVSIETQRASADGKKVIEGCDVRVIDAERGREASAASLSGGERVIVGEAIALALSMLACRRSGVVGATLVRDETGAALDPVNASAYVAMLRRSADIVGASKVLFVSHSQDVQDLADAKIVVANGALAVA